VNQIVEFILRFGFKSYLESFSVNVLQKVADAQDLGVKSSSKQRLITAIVEDKVPKPKERVDRTMPPKGFKIPKRKPKLAHGVGFWEIWHCYSAAELQGWCKKNHIISSGKKKILIERILKFLEGNKENIMVAKSKRGRRKKKVMKKKKDEEESEDDDDDEESEEDEEDEEEEEEGKEMEEDNKKKKRRRRTRRKKIKKKKNKKKVAKRKKIKKKKNKKKVKLLKNLTSLIKRKRK